jgi:hypothetical protein
LQHTQAEFASILIVSDLVIMALAPSLTQAACGEMFLGIIRNHSQGVMIP